MPLPEAPAWATGVGVGELIERCRALPAPAHTRPGYAFPPAHTADGALPPPRPTRCPASPAHTLAPQLGPADGRGPPQCTAGATPGRG